MEWLHATYQKPTETLSEEMTMFSLRIYFPVLTASVMSAQLGWLVSSGSRSDTSVLHLQASAETLPSYGPGHGANKGTESFVPHM